MELSLIKKETIGASACQIGATPTLLYASTCVPSILVGAPSILPENQTIAKYEIMDGAPVKGGCGV